MGYDLRDWALHVGHPCLTPRTRQVLAEICFVAHDEHGEFWMRGRNFLSENIPDMSYGAYRNHLSVLVQNGLLLKIGHGSGPTNRGHGTTTRYRVNSPAIRKPQPAQRVLPEIAQSPEALQRSSEVTEERRSVGAIEAHQHLDELLSDGITPEQIVTILKAVNTTLTGSQDMSDGVTDSADQTCQNTRHVRAEHVCSRDIPSRHEEKAEEENEDQVAAAHLSDAVRECLPSFFDVLASSPAKAGHTGIRAVQFEDMSAFLACYEKLIGSPPDERTAGYIAGRV